MLARREALVGEAPEVAPRPPRQRALTGSGAEHEVALEETERHDAAHEPVGETSTVDRLHVDEAVGEHGDLDVGERRRGEPDGVVVRVATGYDECVALALDHERTGPVVVVSLDVEELLGEHIPRSSRGAVTLEADHGDRRVLAGEVVAGDDSDAHRGAPVTAHRCERDRPRHRVEAAV